METGLHISFQLFFFCFHTSCPTDLKQGQLSPVKLHPLCFFQRASSSNSILLCWFSRIPLEPCFPCCSIRITDLPTTTVYNICIYIYILCICIYFSYISIFATSKYWQVKCSLAAPWSNLADPILRMIKQLTTSSYSLGTAKDCYMNNYHSYSKGP